MNKWERMEKEYQEEIARLPRIQFGNALKELKEIIFKELFIFKAAKLIVEWLNNIIARRRK